MDLTIRQAIARHAQAQDGHVTRVQLRALGATDRMIDGAAARGELQRVTHGRGVFVVPGVPRTWRSDLRAIVLSVPRGAWVCRSAALRVHGVASAAAPFSPEVIVRGSGPVARAGGVVVHRSRVLSEADVTERRGLPVTTPERTVVDLAGELAWYDTLDLVDRLVADRLTTPSAVNRRAHRLARGRKGVARIARATADQGADEFWSWLERRARELLAQAGIRGAEWNVRVPGLPEAGIADTYLRGAGVIIEWHGLSFHRRPDRIRLDHAQRNAATLANLIPLVFTWYDVAARPEHVVATIVAAVRARRAA